MAEHGGNGDEGEVIDRLEGRGGPMAVEEGDQTTAEPVGDEGATAEGHGGDVQSQPQEVGGGERNPATEEEPRATVDTGAVEPSSEPINSGMTEEHSKKTRSDVRNGEDGEKHRATEPEACATVPVGAVGSSSEPLDPSMAVGGFVVTGGNSGDASSGGAGGGGTEPSQTPPRDSAKGKGAVTAEEETPESPMTYREADVVFRPTATAATSSRHVPVTLADVAENTPDEVVAKLLEDYPVIGEMVLRAKEERARVIAAWEAAARAEREREREPGKRSRRLILRPRKEPRRSNLGLKPPQTDYSDELVLRDPGVHIANTWTEAGHRDSRSFGGPCSSLALYIGLPQRVRDLVDAASFREFIQTLTTPVRNEHAVLVALTERWRDTTNTFHLPPGEMTVTPTDFAAITGLRVRGDPIPFDSGIQEDPVALRWFLGDVPRIERGAARYAQFVRGSTVHLSYLPALRDLRTAAHFDWGGAALGTTYLFLGDASRTGQSTAGYWRIWELWAYEVLRMYPLECKHPDLRILPRALKWSKEYMGSKEKKDSLNAYRLYLDELKASQWYLGDRVTRQSLGYTEFRVPGLLPPRASHTRDYTLAELEQFTRPDTELTRHLRPDMDYAAYQRAHLARPLGVRAHKELQYQARDAAVERRAAAGRQKGKKVRVKHPESRPVIGGPPELSWKVPVVDTQGNPAEIHLAPARVEPPPVTVQVPTEWVNEAFRRMLALENIVRRAAMGFPLELRYPPAPQTAQRAAAQRPQTRSSQPIAASKEAAKKTVARAEERYRIEMREVQGREEPVRKRLVMPEPVEEDEEGDEEDEEEVRSESDDTVDDPRYLQDPHELAVVDDEDDDDDDDDDGGDAEEDLGDAEEDLRDADWTGQGEDR
ncbi:hypothetical protein RHMOL_Rhmol01G0368500 [Rhododendron molle]|uniref:Uncharacterized protein n=1 Tax=Rhododendron molle TaxID=49168 RepID=A0ACC0Q9B9_RHOML|nr:hypothetical protein RHMOL_Rhmol01G0368500 [Rhododendron molle]